jgi:hypothetical protein
VSRVLCHDCGIPVVVDPTGSCPDGHHVGAAGARVATAMGTSAPHPDEPEPWVHAVMLDGDAADTPSAARSIQPPSAPGAPAAADPIDAPTDAEALLRELHSLAEGGGPTAGPGSRSTTTPSPLPARPAAPPHHPLAPPAAAAPPAPMAPVTSVPSAPVTPVPTAPLTRPSHVLPDEEHSSPPPRPSSPFAAPEAPAVHVPTPPAPVAASDGAEPALGAQNDGLGALSALEAALSSLLHDAPSGPDGPGDTPVGPAPAPHGHHPETPAPAASAATLGDDLASLLDTHAPLPASAGGGPVPLTRSTPAPAPVSTPPLAPPATHQGGVPHLHAVPDPLPAPPAAHADHPTLPPPAQAPAPTGTATGTLDIAGFTARGTRVERTRRRRAR